MNPKKSQICQECNDNNESLLTLCDSTKCCYHNFFELEQRIRLAIRKKSRKDTINYYEVTITTLPEETAIRS